MAEILVISPTPTHPQDAGNRARIFSLLSKLKKTGHRIHFLFLDRELEESDLASMERTWDSFRRFPWRQPPTLRLKRLYDLLSKFSGSSRVLPYKIDDWFDDSIIPEVRKLSADLNPDIVLVEYVFVSKIFHLFGRNVLKIIDTHDIFGDRHKLFYRNNIRPRWFYTTVAEEKKGLDRADVIIAIQTQDAEYFNKNSEKKVITVGHLTGPVESDQKEPVHPPRLLFVGSSNPSNLDGIKWFLDNIFKDLRQEVPGIELDLIGNAGDFIEPAPGLNHIGRVKELTPYYMKASVVINPLRFGTGLKIKSVEALVMQRPLVTTPNGATGLEEWAGRAFLCAETPAKFGNAILQVLHSRELLDNLKKGAGEFSAEYNRKAFAPLREAIDIFLERKSTISAAGTFR